MAVGSVEDWAAKAARRIMIECQEGYEHSDRREARIAAIIETYAKPLVDLVLASRREHYHCDDSWYCCGKCTHPCDQVEEAPDHEHTEACCVDSHGGEAARTQGVCNCGADKWNAKIDEVLLGSTDDRATDCCRAGWHDDPDNSGMCIRCGLILDPEPGEDPNRYRRSRGWPDVPTEPVTGRR